MDDSRSENNFRSQQIIAVLKKVNLAKKKDLYTRTAQQGCKYYVKST